MTGVSVVFLASVSLELQLCVVQEKDNVAGFLTSVWSRGIRQPRR